MITPFSFSLDSNGQIYPLTDDVLIISSTGSLVRTTDESRQFAVVKPLSSTEILTYLKILKPILNKEYGVSKIGIFGSFARNQAQLSSDIDIVVEMQPDILKRIRIKQSLEEYFGREVDVVRYWQGMNPYLKGQIDRDAHYV